MQRLITFIQTNLFWLVAASIFLGLAVLHQTGGYAFSPIICVIAALAMIFPSLVPLDFDRIKEMTSHAKIIGLTLAINFIVVPLIALALGQLFLANEPALQLGIFLLSILPSGGMVTTWAHKSHAHLPLTVGIVFTNLAAAVLLVPLYLSKALEFFVVAPTSDALVCPLSAATGGAINCFPSAGSHISAWNIAVPILFIVIIPLALAYAMQRALKRAYAGPDLQAVKQKFGAFSNIGMLVVLFILMGVKENAFIFQRPDLILRAALPLAAMYGASALIALFLNRRIGGPEGKSVVWGTYLRYITLALGLSISLIYQNPQYAPIVLLMVLAFFIQIPSSFLMLRRVQT